MFLFNLFKRPKFLIKRKFFILSIFSFLMFILIIFYEEAYTGYLINLYGNFYLKTIYKPLDNKLNYNKTNNIWVIVIINNKQLLPNYQLAQSTLNCYCQLHKYPLIIIDISEEKEEFKQCKQNDFYFRRHCILAKFLSFHNNSKIDFVFFLDADIGVINPNHRLEEFINGKKDFDLIFYERIFNAEIMAGSYILKNTEFTRQFLQYWANYNFKVPNSFHGTDNGAIHAVFLDIFCGNYCSDKQNICLTLWNSSINFNTLLSFTICSRYILGARNVFNSIPNTNLKIKGKIFLLTNISQYWVRDGWLTGNRWSERDLFIHGWQSWRLNRQTFAGWNSPLAKELIENNEENCKNQILAFKEWPYKNTFIKTDEQIKKEIEKIINKRNREQMNRLIKIIN